MGDFESVGSIARKFTYVNTDNNDNNDNNDINKSTSNVNNVHGSTYALKQDFKEYCPEATLSLEMVAYFDDKDNHAFYWKLCLKEGEERARFLFDQVKGEIEEKSKSRLPVRDNKRYFAYMYKRGLLLGQGLVKRINK